MNYLDPLIPARQDQLIGVLESVCQSFELSDAQHASAKQRYEGVGRWLATSDDPVLRMIEVFLQGSTAIGTTVKPIGVNEHDVDLVAHAPDLDTQVSPAALKRAIGDRLRTSGNYSALLEEKPRCWRLNYANEFHMDITPSIPNPNCQFGGELVPDKTLKLWKPSNPRGYKLLFTKRAELKPIFRMRKAMIVADSAEANVEPYPAQSQFKGILRRTVQIAKRHRDVHFIDDPELAPLSIIVTTLASRSYEFCVPHREYDNELELLLEVIRHMPDSIEVHTVGGREQWAIWNETTAGENFAEKWNKHPERAEAFFAWHARFQANLEALQQIRGIDQLSESLKGQFGAQPASAAIGALTERVSTARRTNSLRVAPAIGLTAGAAARSTAVRANTFYGRGRD